MRYHRERRKSAAPDADLWGGIEGRGALAWRESRASRERRLMPTYGEASKEPLAGARRRERSRPKPTLGGSEGGGARARRRAPPSGLRRLPPKLPRACAGSAAPGSRARLRTQARKPTSAPGRENAPADAARASAGAS